MFEGLSFHEIISTLLGVSEERLSDLTSKGLQVLLILVFGWILTFLVEILLKSILDYLRFDKLCEKLKINQALKKGNLKILPSGIVAGFVYWILLFVVILFAAQRAGLQQVSVLTLSIINYIPNIGIAIILLILGLKLAGVLMSVVEASAENVGLPHAGTLGKLTYFLTMVLTVLVMLEQLKIASTFATTTMTILLGSLGGAFVLAVGLGCKDVVHDIVSEWRADYKKGNIKKGRK